MAALPARTAGRTARENIIKELRRLEGGRIICGRREGERAGWVQEIQRPLWLEEEDGKVRS
jgi:hypothetical protein